MIMNINPENIDSMASKTLVSNNLTTQHKNPEIHNFFVGFCFVLVTE
jgi:hypothetical protein